jgi:ferrochelatase
VVPVAFVSEHVETLNEIDIQYAAAAKLAGIDEFDRVCALKCHPSFIRCLADQAEKAVLGCSARAELAVASRAQLGHSS